MSDPLDKIKQHVGSFASGMMRQLAPEIAGSVVNELFKQWQVDVTRIVADVQNDRSLWEDLSPEQRQQVVEMAGKVGNLDIITTQTVVHGIKDDFPAVASLFVSWPEAHEWLERQIADLKRQATEGHEPNP